MDKIYCWACDISKNTGEGNLANEFLKKLKINNNVYIFDIQKLNITNNFLLKILNYKYISPFVGLVFCWYLFLQKKKISYINYLPLWNFMLFIFLPPKIILGPITGGANFKNNNKLFVRKYIFPILYKISEIFINFRLKKISFSTDLLKPFLKKSTIAKSNFNYIFNLVNKKKNNPKNIDFLIYYRKHNNKESFFPYSFIKKLISLNFKVHIVGDYLNFNSVTNYGYVDNKFVNRILSKTFYTLASNENLYSLFTIESINNHVKIIVDKNQFKKIKFFKENFICLDFNKIYNINYLKIIKSTINNPIIHY
jgi:hypothetical protein